MLIVLLTSALACGGGTSDTTNGGGTTIADPEPVVGPVNQSGDRNVTANIGSPGGTLSLTNGARVEFPAGALSEAAEVHFSVGTQTHAFNNRDYEKPVGPTIHLQPDMALSGGLGVSVSIPMASIPSGFSEDDLTLALEIPAGRQRSSVMGSTQTTWMHIPASSQNGRFVAQITERVPGMRLQFLVSEEEE